MAVAAAWRLQYVETVELRDGMLETEHEARAVDPPSVRPSLGGSGIVAVGA